MDNGSTDDTVKIARDADATIYQEPNLSISGLRNAGAQRANGRILVFIDADVYLTADWAGYFPDLASRILAGEKLLTGSQYAAEVKNFLLNRWYESVRLDPRSNSLPGGHMIIARKDYLALGGQNEALAVGEDFEFCQRATLNGFKIENKHELKVIHDSTPKNFSAFYKRQRWHGSSDFQDIQSILNSKVAIGSIIFMFLHLCLILSIPFSTSATVATLVFILFFLILTSVYKFQHMPWLTLACNAATCYVYYLGRASSAFFPERRAVIIRK